MADTTYFPEKATILVVDDTADNLTLMMGLLEREYCVKVANNGEKALKIAQSDTPPDLILLDVMMPKIDGYEVYRRLQNNPLTCDIPVIFVTTASDNKYEIQALELGAADYITKPINPAIALLRIRNQVMFQQSIHKLRMASVVFENVNECIVIVDRHGNIIDVNPAFTNVTGYSRTEALGKNKHILTSELHSREFYNTIRRQLKIKGKWQGELWGKRKNGDQYIKFLSISTIVNNEKQIDRYFAVFSDITQYKHYEQEVKRLSESALNKAKLEAEKANLAKSDFLSCMSHELRTPMNAVLGFAQLLESEDLTEDQLDSVKEIITAGHHLLDLINDVLDLSKIEAEKMELFLEKVDLNALIKNCLTLMQPLTFKNSITIINQINTDAQNMVMVDGLRLKQVLLNLISNAIKYNRVGGRITLSCQLTDLQLIRINIADTGNGLSPMQLAKLFQPFERLSAKNSNVEGTGIGLCISKKLIENMGGRIGVQSTVGEGSCFWVDIPLA